MRTENLKFAGLAPGLYNIRVELAGFGTVDQTGVQVSEGPSQMSFTLAPGGLEETMVVSASKIETPLVNAPATMSVLSSAQIELLLLKIMAI